MATKISTPLQCGLVALVGLVPTHVWAAPSQVASQDNSTAIAAAALGLGIAIFGGALGQGRAAGAAYEGICRNPGAADKVFIPMLLGLALIESLVILGFVGLNMVLFS